MSSLQLWQYRSPGGSGRSWGLELLHCFPAKFHSHQRHCQTTCNKSLGCILLASFSDLLELCFSPSVLHIMFCLFHHQLTCEWVLVSTRLHFCRAEMMISRYVCIFPEVRTEYYVPSLMALFKPAKMN